MNIRNADVHEAREGIGIGGHVKRNRRLVGRRTAADIDDEPRVRDLDVARRAALVASAQDAASEDRFVKSRRPFDVGDGKKMRDGNPVLRRHLIRFLPDLYFAHGRLPPEMTNRLGDGRNITTTGLRCLPDFSASGARARRCGSRAKSRNGGGTLPRRFRPRRTGSGV